MNFEKIFEKDAFKFIEKEKIELFKSFAKKIQGKNIDDMFLDIINFYNNLPKGKELTDYERQAIIESILHSLEPNERKKFLNVIEMIETLN